MSDDFDDEITRLIPAPIPPWTPVHSVRGKFIHLAYDGKNTLCGVRLRTLVAAPELEIDCHGCWFASRYN